MKKYIKGFIHGLLIGFAFISAMGGGTLAVILGIYDDLVSAVTNLRKDFKNSVKYLAPILVGAVVGIAALAYPIKLFLEWQPFIATSLFVGLTIGGLVVFKTLTKGQANRFNMIFVLIGFVLVAGIGVLSWFTADGASTAALTLTPTEAVVLFLIGFFASSALIAPGISGTMFLISLGYYNRLLDLIKSFLSFSGPNWGSYTILILIFTIGFVIGFFMISKLMDYLLKHFRVATYFSILGLILGQIIISYFNGDIKTAYQTINFSVWQVLFSILALSIGVISSLMLLKIADKKQVVQHIEVAKDDAS